MYLQLDFGSKMTFVSISIYISSDDLVYYMYLPFK